MIIAGEGWRRETVEGLLQRQAEVHGSRPAVAVHDGSSAVTYTYEVLLPAARAAASSVEASAAASQTAPVLTWSANSIEVVLALLGCGLLGRPFLPMNPACTDAELRDVIERFGVGLVLVGTDAEGRSLMDRAAAWGLKVPVVDLREIHDGDRHWQASLPVEPDAVLLVQLTSGTTGRPKGAMLTHEGFINGARSGAEMVGADDTDRWCCPYPLFHVSGTTVLFTMLAVGGSVTFTRRFDAGLTLRLCQELGATGTHTVPTTAQALLDHPLIDEVDLSALRYLWCGGASVPSSLVERLESRLGAAVLNGYGQSESPWISQTVPSDDRDAKARTVGRPLPFRQVRIVSRAGSQTPDRVGEVQVRSAVSMIGYLGDPQASADAVDAEGWLATGDLGEIDDAGYLRIHGRLRELIISGGENVYPIEVEDRLVRHDDVAEVAVVGLPHERWGEVVAGVIVLAEGAETIDVAALTAFARQHLSAFKVPRRWIVLDELPHTASGKVRKVELVQMLRADDPRWFQAP